jgi:hypothetical protein
MALVCNITTAQLNPFVFIDCASVNISYSVTGMTNVSFTVISTSSSIDLSSYQVISFGSNNGSRTDGTHVAGRITYRGYVTGYELGNIPGTRVYEHKLSLIAWGCKE